VNESRIRPIAIAIIRREEEILVFEEHDPIKGETFYRPLGGGIEFGERGEEAVRREIREELNLELDEVHYLGTLESIFIFGHDGRPGHEIVQVYDAVPADTSLYQLETMTATEENGQQLNVMWKDLSSFAGSETPLYPDGLLELLR
jgi:8-oxo-dGTP pyrophosphatase MutT (NUDIX family)